MWFITWALYMWNIPPVLFVFYFVMLLLTQTVYHQSQLFYTLKCILYNYQNFSFYSFDLLTWTCFHEKYFQHLHSVRNILLLSFDLDSLGSWGGLLCIVMRVWDGQLKNCDTIAGRSKRFFLYSQHTGHSWCPLSSVVNGYWGHLPQDTVVWTCRWTYHCL